MRRQGDRSYPDKDAATNDLLSVGPERLKWIFTLRQALGTGQNKRNI
jgi:hypothetical protein